MDNVFHPRPTSLINLFNNGFTLFDGVGDVINELLINTFETQLFCYRSRNRRTTAPRFASNSNEWMRKLVVTFKNIRSLQSFLDTKSCHESVYEGIVMD